MDPTFNIREQAQHDQGLEIAVARQKDAKSRLICTVDLEVGQ